MEVSALTLRVLLLFFPGVLCAMLVDALTVHRERTATQFLTHSFVLGLTSYLLLYTVQGVCAQLSGVLGLPPPLPVTFIDALLNDKLRIAWGEIVLAGVFAVGLGAALSAGINHKILYRVGRTLKITRRRGGLDIWGILFDSPRTNWIIARDLEHGLTYFGWLEAYSETNERAELLLSDVAVAESSTGTKLYDSGMLYFAQDAQSLSIEIVSPPADQGVRDGRPEFPPVGTLRGGEVQSGRMESQFQDATAEHRNRAPGSARAGPASRQRKRKRDR
jgi:hypothetical protein